MSHNIANVNGRDSIAFRGSILDIWHELGQEMAAGMSVDDWARAAGLDWRAILADAYVQLPNDVLPAEQSSRMRLVPDVRHVIRSDNGHVLGTVSSRYQPVQPRDVLEWFQQYISVDPHFELDVAGALKQGEIIWATATYNGGLEVGGSKHVARLLMTTTFDGTSATINKGTMTRVVCNNTLDAALGDTRCEVRTRHSTRFDAKRVGLELQAIAKSFHQFKAMGDAMATATMAKPEISDFFKELLEIPFDAKREDISTKKMNTFNDLNRAYIATCAEGTEKETKWAALNAVTRYVDHDRDVRNARGNVQEARFVAGQFGSGAQLKARAVDILSKGVEYKMDDGDLLKAISAKTDFMRTGAQA